ncbi:MAG: preprotein translocase subunit SecE [Zoogloeaceae bacterium]|jgi:preprotein translocase subunit SecE|nr:preprotein translocase subunit SecE [Zoogloeaceae bacterium]
MAEKIKIAFALLLVAAGVAGFYLLSDQPMILRVLAVGAGVIAGVLLFLRLTELGGRFGEFCRESWVELGKVVWPSRKETVQMTGVVFAFVVVMALFLFLTDKTLEWVLYDLVLGWKRS